MPSYPCAQCSERFAKPATRDLHIANVHDHSRRNTTVPTPSPYRGTSSYFATVLAPSPIEDEAAKKVEPPPKKRKASPGTQAISESLHGPIERKFTIWYEAKGYSATQKVAVPSSEPFHTFLARLATISNLAAISFIKARFTGFTLDDGPWRYTLIDRKRSKAGPERDLTSPILYQAMISDLLKAASPWTYALIWHEKQKGDPLPKPKPKKKVPKPTTPENEPPPTNPDPQPDVPISQGSSRLSSPLSDILPPKSPARDPEGDEWAPSRGIYD